MKSVLQQGQKKRVELRVEDRAKKNRHVNCGEKGEKIIRMYITFIYIYINSCNALPDAQYPDHKPLKGSGVKKAPAFVGRSASTSEKCVCACACACACV